MKRSISILLIALLILALIGCGGQSEQSASAAAPAAAEPAKTEAPAKPEVPAAEAPAAAEPAPAAAQAPSFVGSWKLYAQEGELGAAHEELEARVKANGLDLPTSFSTTFRDDGTATVCLYGSLLETAWKDNGDGTGTLTLNQDAEMKLEDGFLKVFSGANWWVNEPSEKSADQFAKPKTSPLVGNWLYYSQEGINGGTTVTHDDVEQYRAQGLGSLVDIVLSIYEDGSCKMLAFGDLDEGVWKDNGDGTATLEMLGKTLQLSIEDGMLVSTADDNISRFEKTDRSAA